MMIWAYVATVIVQVACCAWLWQQRRRERLSNAAFLAAFDMRIAALRAQQQQFEAAAEGFLKFTRNEQVEVVH